jgi:hypothetical protein
MPAVLEVFVHVSAELACMCVDWRQLIMGCNSVLFWCYGKSELNGLVEFLGSKIGPQLLPGFRVPIVCGLGIDKGRGREL